MSIATRWICLIGLTWMAGSTNLLAQVLCTPGSVWYHDRPLFGYSCYDRAELVGDTLVDGVLAHRLEVTGLCNGEYWGQGVFGTTDSDILLHVDGDLVRLYSFSDWDTLFFFGAAPGDHWSIPDVTTDYGCTMDARITVQDTGHMVVQGLALRFLAVEAKHDDFNFYPDTIIERIGALRLSLRLWSFCHIDDGYGALRCFSDSAISYTVSSEFGCTSVAGIEDAVSSDRATFHMEGTVAVLDLPPALRSATVTLLDVTGRVRKVAQGSGRVTMPCERGVNVLRVTSSTGPDQVFRSVIP